MSRRTVKTFDVCLPSSWAELTQKQLKFVFRLLAKDKTAEEVKTLCLVAWNKLEVVRLNTPHRFLLKRGKEVVEVSTRDIQKAMRPLDFIDVLPEVPLRLEKIGLHRALPADFEGVPFEKYLFLENLFQGYLHTEDDNLLKQMAQILYDKKDINPDKAELISIFYWFASLKRYFTYLFPNFLKPIPAEKNLIGSADLYRKLSEATNAQLRALTGGDVTKEAQVRAMDTHRALTELDAKAKEAEELRKTMKS